MKTLTRDTGIRFSCLVIAMIGAAVSANTLYSDGAPSGSNSWSLGYGAEVEDSFTLSSLSTLTGVIFGNWLEKADTGISVQWSIVGTEGSQTPVCVQCTGTATLTAAGTFTVNSFYKGVDQSITLPNIALSAGTYWLEFQNEVVSNADMDVWWDINGGPSQVWVEQGGKGFDQTGQNCAVGPGECADSFTIVGTSVPEPGSAILLGGGLIAAGAIGCWRRVRRPCPNLQSKTQPVTPQITTNLRGDRAKDLALL